MSSSWGQMNHLTIAKIADEYCWALLSLAVVMKNFSCGSTRSAIGVIIDVTTHRKIRCAAIWLLGIEWCRLGRG
jgi:hypothetical protein